MKQECEKVRSWMIRMNNHVEHALVQMREQPGDARIYVRRLSGIMMVTINEIVEVLNPFMEELQSSMHSLRKANGAYQRELKQRRLEWSSADRSSDSSDAGAGAAEIEPQPYVAIPRIPAVPLKKKRTTKRR